MIYLLQVENGKQTEHATIGEAIGEAKRHVYAGTTATQRAYDDLGAGRIAEWSYGFNAVRIYPQKGAA